MSDLEDLSKQQTSDDQIEGQSIQSEIFEEFCGDLESTDSLSVTDQEFQALSGVSLLGILNSKEDVMFILRQIRESMKPSEAQVSEPPDSTHTLGRKIDEPMRDFHQITETIRRAALAKLDDLDLQAARRSRTAVGRLESAWRCVTMMLSRVHSFVAQVSHKLVRRSVISLPV